MNTHDIDRLIDKIESSAAMDIAGRSKYIHDLRAAIEADRKRWGELVGYFVNVNRYNGQKPQWEQLSDDYKDVDDAIPLYTAPQHAEPIVSDVEAIVRLLESREWAEHVATTPLGQRLETAVTVLVGADQQPSEPVKVPSDSAIMFEWSQTPNTGDMRVDLIAFARALLARYGQHAEPVEGAQ